MFRDRTNLFLSYRQSFSHNAPGSAYGPGDERHGLMGGTEAEHKDVEMGVLPPVWLDTGDAVDRVLALVSSKLNVLAGLYKKNALPGFDDRTSDEREISRLSFEVTRHLHECFALIARFDTAKTTSPSEARLCHNMKAGVAARVQKVSTHFRHMQSTYLSRLGGGSFGDEVSLGANESDEKLAQSALTQVHSGDKSAVVRQREHEIDQIAQGIIELSGMFKQLEHFVIDQGTVLDRVDYNIEKSHVQVRAADTELVRASGHQRRTQRCKLILLLVLIIVALIVVLCIRRRPNAAKGTPDREN